MNRITDQELEALKNAKDQKEWDAICDQITANRDGQYPCDWTEKVLFGKVIKPFPNQSK